MADEWIDVGAAAELSAGAITYVDVRGTPMALCHVDGELYAVGNVCTHDNGSLSGGALDGYQIECPRHGARFDVRNGQVICLPAAAPIPTYAVKQEDGRVKVRLGA